MALRPTCNVCSNLLPDTLLHLAPNQYATIFIQASSLANSVQQGGCTECKLLSDAITIRHKNWQLCCENWNIIQLDVAKGKPLQLRHRSRDSEVTFLQIYSGFQSDSLPQTIGLASEISQSSNSPESLELIKKWHWECTTNHECCKQRLPSAMPTRLLDLSNPDPLLIETIGMQMSNYVALSYCWGSPDKHPTLCTTSTSYMTHQAGIKLQSIPIALKDAINLTKKIGFRYIWIDALCIIQDDAKDWAGEAATMCQVYSQAALTIIGSRSDGTSSSLFGDQVFAQFNIVSYKDTDIRVRRNIARDHEINPVIPLRSDPDPISRRAWTFQEAVLSNRAIHITSDELRWECNTWRRCQCGQLAVKFPLSYDAEEIQYEGYRLWRLNNFFPDTVKDAYDMWQAMLVSYTNRRLTKQEDRLVALSGLAQRFAMAMYEVFGRHETYLAGIWKDALPEQLLWFVELRKFSILRGNTHDRPSLWRAPSWSWASMEASVNYLRSSRLENRIELLGIQYVPATADVFGQVDSATLRVRAPMLHDVQFVVDPEEILTSRYRAVRWHDLELRIATSYLDNDFEGVTDAYLADTKQKFSLLVVGYGKGTDLHECLALTPVAGKQQTFERIALVRLGQHLREPKEHRMAIDAAPPEEITLA